MPIAFYVAGHLTAFTDGKSNLTLSTTPVTLREALDDLWRAYPGLKDRVVTEQGRVRPHVIVFIGNDDIRNLDGLETEVIKVGEISILPAVSGGSSPKLSAKANRELLINNRQARKQIPFDFVLEHLEPLSPVAKPFFGCTAVYVGEKIVLILRNKIDGPESNGVWLATTCEHHQSLQRDFPTMRSIGVLGTGTTGWQLLHVSDVDFEGSVMRACELILSGDPRIGKVPKRKSVKPVEESKGSQKRKKVVVSRVRKRQALNRDDD